MLELCESFTRPEGGIRRRQFGCAGYRRGMARCCRL